jgi:hypothetical protein
MITKEELLELGFEEGYEKNYECYGYFYYTGYREYIFVNLDKKFISCTLITDTYNATKANILKFIEIIKLIGELE